MGRDLFGVFPLRGKLLNVREMTAKEVIGNAEVAAIVTVLGLDFAKSYGAAGPTMFSCAFSHFASSTL